MKNLILFAVLFFAHLTNAQLGVAIVSDPTAQALIADSNALLIQAQTKQGLADSKSLLEAQKTVAQVTSQFEYIKNTVSKVSNAVQTVQAATDLKNQIFGVVQDYNNAIGKLQNMNNLPPAYVQNSLNILSGVISNNQKTSNFLGDILKDDFFKLTSYERIKLIEDLNGKVYQLRMQIYNVLKDATVKSNLLKQNNSIYNTPLLK